MSHMSHMLKKKKLQLCGWSFAFGCWRGCATLFYFGCLTMKFLDASPLDTSSNAGRAPQECKSKLYKLHSLQTHPTAFTYNHDEPQVNLVLNQLSYRFWGVPVSFCNLGELHDLIWAWSFSSAMRSTSSEEFSSIAGWGEWVPPKVWTCYNKPADFTNKYKWHFGTHQNHWGEFQLQGALHSVLPTASDWLAWWFQPGWKLVVTEDNPHKVIHTSRTSH